jgi:Icc-related predicted phosphoesterase
VDTAAPEGRTAVRVAAIGDLHFGDTDDPERLAVELGRCAHEADVLLIAGDLTSHGRAEQAHEVARALAPIEIPKIAVLGNHDYENDGPEDVRSIVEQEAHVQVLDCESCVVEVNGCRLGVAGVKGFGGGFRGASASDFGEPEMKDFIRHTIEVSRQLEELLAALDADRKVALLHYSPVEATLAGERLELYPFLGSYFLCDAVERGGADLVLHGHAHLGSERGTTPAGIDVRNVALPVLKRPYAVYPLG